MSPGPLISIFGPTGTGKTGVAIELGRLLRARGEDPVAVNCDSIQVYQGLEILSGASDAIGQTELEHRLLCFIPVDQDFSAGRYAELARAEIDSLIAQGKRPILVGGTGLYLRGALSRIEFQPPVPAEIREQVGREIEQRGAATLHGELPEAQQQSVHVNDRVRIARATELLRSGRLPAADHEGGGELWTAALRHPTLLIGLADDPECLAKAIRARVEAMAAAGAGAEAAQALEAGASRTARAAIGFDQFLAGDLERAAILHRQFARRQMTWMRRMEGVVVIERLGRTDRELAEQVLSLCDPGASGDAGPGLSG